MAQTHTGSWLKALFVWLALIALPALAWFISILGPTWSLPHVDAIVTTLNAVGTLIGILIGASTLKSKMTFTV